MRPTPWVERGERTRVCREKDRQREREREREREKKERKKEGERERVRKRVTWEEWNAEDHENKGEVASERGRERKKEEGRVEEWLAKDCIWRQTDSRRQTHRKQEGHHHLPVTIPRSFDHLINS